jgi:hypothetical protein
MAPTVENEVVVVLEVCTTADVTVVVAVVTGRTTLVVVSWVVVVARADEISRE